MIKRLGVRDLIKHIPALSGYTEMDLIKKCNDDAVLPFLWYLGMDVYKAWEVEGSKYRSIDGKIILGFSYIGFERTDRAWLDSPYATIEAHIESHHDNEFKYELYKMCGLHNSVGRMYSRIESQSPGTLQEPYDYYEKDYAEVVEAIKIMRKYIKAARGLI